MTPVQLNCHLTVAPFRGSDVVSRSPNIVVLMRSNSHIGFGCLFGFSRRQMRLENILGECQRSAADFAFATEIFRSGGGCTEPKVQLRCFFHENEERRGCLSFYFVLFLLFPSRVSNRDPVSSAHVPRFTFRELAVGWDWGGFFFYWEKFWGGRSWGWKGRFGKGEWGEGEACDGSLSGMGDERGLL